MRDEDYETLDRGQGMACRNKRYFVSRQGAEDWGRITVWPAPRAYHCSICDGWHLTRRAARGGQEP